MLSLINKFKQQWGLIILTVFFAFIFARNYPAGKWLIGWDALTPEFNFVLNLKHALQASWQPHYGSGAATGHGYGATLPHVLITGFLSLFLPLTAVRPVFIMICWYIGGIGMYHLLRYLMERVGQKNQQQPTPAHITLLAIAGALFYSFNLGTTQIFYHPLEAFTAQFAIIPWTLLPMEKYFATSKNSQLLLLFLLSFLGSIQGFIPVNFLAYMVLVSGFLITRSIGKHWWQQLKKAVTILGVILLANSYWLPSFLYYTATNSQVFLNSYQNQLSTPQFVVKTAKYGTLEKVVTLQSFFLEGKLFNENVFSPWLHFIDVYPINYWYYTIFSLACLAVVLTYQKKYRFLLAYFIPGIFFFGSLATHVPLFSTINLLLYKLSPLYEQAFRTAFTKVGLGYFALLTVVVSLALYWLLTLVRFKVLQVVASTALLLLVLLSIFPHFQGNSFYKQLKIDLPTANTQVIEFFKTQPSDGYVADLPLGCPDGWYSYNWGYSGSGFYWYGVEQPFLSRAFDVWNQYNESYYWQAQRAIHERDFKTLDSVFSKYQVSWVLVDPNLDHCKSGDANSYLTDLQRYLSTQPQYQQVFANSNGVSNQVAIFKKTTAPQSKTVQIIDQIEPTTDKDYLYSEQAPYIENVTSQPRLTLFSKRKSLDRVLSVVESESTVSAEAKLMYQGQPLISTPVELYNLDTVLSPKPCNGENKNLYEQAIALNGQIKSVRVETKQSSDCISVWTKAPDFIHGGVITFDAYNYSGLPFKLTVMDDLSQTYLELFVQNGHNLFVIPPVSPIAKTLTIDFTSQSFGDVSSNNLLENMVAGTTNVPTLERIVTQQTPQLVPINIVTIPSHGQLYHRLQIEGSTLVVLGTSYQNDWFAISQPSPAPWWQLSSYSRITSHTRYNGWANAWIIPDRGTHTVLLFYWPQLLSFAGFIALGVSGGVILTWSTLHFVQASRTKMSS